MQVDLTKLVYLSLCLLGIAGLVVLMYAVPVRNDLARRYQRLLALAANVRAVRQRRQGVGHDVARHLKYAQRHEQRVTRFGSVRGRGGSKHINLSDNFNGWPGAGVTGVTSEGMGLDNQSRNLETTARDLLHNEAAEYNALIESWPVCLIAARFGYRHWRFNSRGRTRSKRSH